MTEDKMVGWHTPPTHTLLSFAWLGLSASVSPHTPHMHAHTHTHISPRPPHAREVRAS